MNMRRWILAILMLAAATALSGCKHSQNNVNAYALSSTGSLLEFSTGKPGNITSEVKISGLSSNQSVVQLKFRPSNGLLYGLTNDAQLCVINTSTGVASLVGNNGPFTSSTLANPQISVDPVADVLRVISTDQNLTVYLDNGVLRSSGNRTAYVSSDPNANTTPNLAGLAYDNNRAGASQSTLYALDQSTQSLVTVGSISGNPNSADSGLLFTVGKLGVSFGGSDGFTIDTRGTAFALLAPSGAGASLYTINLSSGQATLAGALGAGDRSVIALAVAPD